MKYLATLAILLSLSACGVLYEKPVDEKTITTKEQAIALVGQQPTNDQAEQTIKDYLSAQLKDPYTVQYRFVDSLQPGWKSIPWPNKSIKYGWVKCVWVNGKNSYGAYTGYTLYYFILRNGEVIYKENEYVQITQCKK